MRLLTLLLLGCAVLAGQPASFEGVAIHSVTRQPLEGVHIRLVGFNFDGPGEAYGAMSDRSGHFAISSMKPGPYLLVPEYRGFVYPYKKESVLPFRTVTLKAGEHVSDFQVEMSPHAVIVGRVVDEYGDPLPRVTVQAEAASSDVAVISPSLAGNPGNYNTDDRGKFRVVLSAGKYYVKAQSMMGGSGGPPEIRTDGTAPAEYAATWYPSAAAKERAVVVELQAGGEAAIEIRMTRAAPERRITVSGVIRGIPDGNRDVYVQLLPVANGRITGGLSSHANPDGHFTFMGVTPGTYRVTAMSMGPTRLQSPLLEVTLDTDSSNLELHLTGSGDVTGTLEFIGAPAGATASMEKSTVRLDAAGAFRFGQTLSDEVNQDGTFHIGGVTSGRFTVHVEPLPENAYISSLVVDGSPVKGDVLDLSSGSRSSRIKIMVSTNGATISGALLEKDGSKLATTLAMVLMVDDPAKLDLNGGPGKMARVGPDGKYSFHGVRPGKYRLLAIDVFHSPNIEDPESMKKLGAAAEEFEIKAGDRITRDIKVVTKEDADAKPKQ